jgi:hypothetical protein
MYKEKECVLCKTMFKPNSNRQKYCSKCKKKKCLTCGKVFTYEPKASKKSKGLYCSMSCYHKSRWKSEGVCKNCGKPLKTQAVYCSEKCRKDYWNRNDYHLIKKKRIWERKLDIIERLGGKCMKCG